MEINHRQMSVAGVWGLQRNPTRVSLTSLQSTALRCTAKDESNKVKESKSDKCTADSNLPSPLILAGEISVKGKPPVSKQPLKGKASPKVERKETKTRKKVRKRKNPSTPRKVVMSLHTAGLQVLRYSTHACVDPSRKRKIVRPPGLLVYYRRSALINMRLRKRQGRGRRRNSTHYRLILPPKRRRKRSNGTSRSRVRDVLKKKSSRSRGLDGFLSDSAIEGFVKSKGFNDYHSRRVTTQAKTQKGKSKHLPGKKKRRNVPESGGVGVVEGDKLMPISEWKIVLRKKEKKVEPSEDETSVDDQEGEAKDQEGAPEIDEIAERVASPRWVLDRWQVLSSELPETESMSWQFPMLPRRSITTAGSLSSDNSKNSFLDLRKPKFSFEVLASSLRLHPKAGELGITQENDKLPKGLLKDRTVVETIPAPSAAIKRRDSFVLPQIATWKRKTEERRMLSKEKSILAVTGNSLSVPEPRAKSREPASVTVVDTPVGFPENKSKNNETNRTTSKPEMRTGQKEFSQVAGNVISTEHDTKDDKDSSFQETFKLPPCEEVKIPSNNRVEITETSPAKSCHETPTSNVKSKLKAIKSKLPLAPQVPSTSKEPKPLSMSSFSAQDIVYRMFSRDGREGFDRDLSETESSDPESEEEDKTKPKRKKKKGRRKKKKAKDKEKVDPVNEELAQTDFLESEILSELLKLQIPEGRKRDISKTQDQKAKKKKKKRKRSGSKKKDAQKRSLKEELLVSLNRNTAFWYEVTSRLKTVTEQPEATKPEEARPPTPPSPPSKTKKKLKAAVKKFKKLADGGDRRSNPADPSPSSSPPSSSPSSPSRPRLPPVSGETPSRSKFFQAASAVITAERNYYSLLPPLNTSWSDTLDDLFPSLIQDSEDSGLGGEKKPAKRRARRGGKKKGEEGGLDDPGQTGVSTVNDSRAGSGRRSGSAHSSKPTSARSSKSSSAHRRLHDPLSYDPKQFLGASHPPEDGSELAKLQETLGGGPVTNIPEAEVFWLSLPRSPSHRAAVFTLPVQMNRLIGVTSLEYLKKYMQVITSRRQLYSMIFTRHRDLESIREIRVLVDDFGAALGDALGGKLTEAQLERLKALVPLPEVALEREFFILISSFAERLFCYELLAAPDVYVEPRDLVEQLDFQHLDERLEGVELDPRLHDVLVTIRDMG